MIYPVTATWFKRFWLAFLLFTISISARAQEGWHQQSGGTGVNLNSVCFTDVYTGTAAGDAGVLLGTMDGGLYWSPQTSHVSDSLLGISFCDANTGMAVGHSGTILYTHDAGQTWITAQSGWMITFRAAQMIDSMKGVAAGTNTIFQPLVSITSDGWQSWDSYTFYLKQGSVNHEGGLTDIDFVNPTYGFASAYVWNGEGALCRTHDGGKSWNTIFWGSHAFNSIDFPSEQTGYAVGDHGVIVKTSDGGMRWAVQNSNISLNLYGVDFATEKRGYAVGQDQAILRTIDGGTTWTLQESITGETLRSVQFIDPNTAYAVGENGSILCTHDAGGDTLIADQYNLSGSGGGTLIFSLNAGTLHNNRDYIILGSASGVSPGFPLPGGLVLLLNWDLLTDIICAYLNTPLFSNFHNTLDIQGKAAAHIETGPLPTGAIGLVLNFAYALNDPWDFHSNPIYIGIIP
ncbi:MAG: YCF48-related protein [Planctomycetota bacterium]